MKLPAAVGKSDGDCTGSVAKRRGEARATRKASEIDCG